ncbi:uncharacterized protein L3040_005808 [Drepanopeziza brunnea f. sp. 'multigermtubi']|uniref:uncharacterized protein n=1 Tax=Drepanopeziza brunnea f. sp. 'multigermtubi' TaxID=698441 RepID=UPI00238A4B74|nr:hypothetical protein L3040_005808 [Drepanopeziza brunnea f. sp. 'multigermtubi']
MNATSSWEVGSRSGLVSIGTHSLWLQAAGPKREPGDPAVVIITGLASCAASWAAVVRLLGAHMRVYVYDRSGLGRSEPSALLPTLSNICAELGALLRAAGVGPPYIIVGHSRRWLTCLLGFWWGGILSRKFIVGREAEVAGMVFVEANQEQTLVRLDWRPICHWFVKNEIDIQKVLGFPARSKLTAAEWEQYQVDEAASYANGQAAAEHAQYADSLRELGTHRQLFRRPPYLASPVAVVIGSNAKDLRKLYDAVVAKNHAAPEPELERQYRAFLDIFGRIDGLLQSEIASLGAKSRVCQSLGGGHDVQLTDPGLIVDVVRWVIAVRDYRGGGGGEGSK